MSKPNSEPLDKRQRILMTAFGIFSKHGYRRVNMKEIAEAAGISRPGLYLYFKTKEDIFSAVIAYFGRSELERGKKELVSKSGLEAKLKLLFEICMVEIFALSCESAEIKEITEASLTIGLGALAETYENLERYVAELLKIDGKARKKLFSNDRTAHLLVSAARGCKTAAANPAELRKMIHDLIKIFALT